ncbi:42226_t:CDS:2, partial [Gigaspora margarita]
MATETARKSFKYKGKIYKTCANCLISKAKKRRKLDNKNTQPTTIETILAQSLCNYIENLISNVENNNGILFEIHIDLNDNMFSEVESNNLKSIARVIVNKVEEEAILKLRYDIIHKKPEDVSTPEEIKQEI